MAFVIQNACIPGYISRFERLINGSGEAEKETMLLREENSYYSKTDDYQLIPGRVFAYWKSQSIIESFKYIKLDDELVFRQGMSTTDNEKYLRTWQEVSFDGIGFGMSSRDDSNTDRPDFRRFFQFCGQTYHFCHGRYVRAGISRI